MLTDKDDILIELKKELQRLKSNNQSVEYLIYEEVDTQLDLDMGSAKKYLQDVVEESGFEIVRAGATRVELKKKPVPSFGRIERG